VYNFNVTHMRPVAHLKLYSLRELRSLDHRPGCAPGLYWKPSWFADHWAVRALLFIFRHWHLCYTEYIYLPQTWWSARYAWRTLWK